MSLPTATPCPPRHSWLPTGSRQIVKAEDVSIELDYASSDPDGSNDPTSQHPNICAYRGNIYLQNDEICTCCGTTGKAIGSFRSVFVWLPKLEHGELKAYDESHPFERTSLEEAVGPWSRYDLSPIGRDVAVVTQAAVLIDSITIKREFCGQDLSLLVVKLVVKSYKRAPPSRSSTPDQAGWCVRMVRPTMRWRKTV